MMNLFLIKSKNSSCFSVIEKITIVPKKQFSKKFQFCKNQEKSYEPSFKLFIPRFSTMRNRYYSKISYFMLNYCRDLSNIWSRNFNILETIFLPKTFDSRNIIHKNNYWNVRQANFFSSVTDVASNVNSENSDSSTESSNFLANKTNSPDDLSKISPNNSSESTNLSSNISDNSEKIPNSANSSSSSASSSPSPCPPLLFDGETEVLTEEQQKQKEELIAELTRRLSGPLADEYGNVPTGKDRPTAIEVDGPSHFYANSTKYTAYTKLKHRLLTRMGYRVLHVPYFEWRKLRGAKEREEYMKNKLNEEPTEWLDPEDEKYYTQRIHALHEHYSQQYSNSSEIKNNNVDQNSQDKVSNITSSDEITAKCDENISSLNCDYDDKVDVKTNASYNYDEKNSGANMNSAATDRSDRNHAPKSQFYNSEINIGVKSSNSNEYSFSNLDLGNQFSVPPPPNSSTRPNSPRQKGSTSAKTFDHMNFTDSSKNLNSNNKPDIHPHKSAYDSNSNTTQGKVSYTSQYNHHSGPPPPSLFNCDHYFSQSGKNNDNNNYGSPFNQDVLHSNAPKNDKKPSDSDSFHDRSKIPNPDTTPMTFLNKTSLSNDASKCDKSFNVETINTNLSETSGRIPVNINGKSDCNNFKNIDNLSNDMENSNDVSDSQK